MTNLPRKPRPSQPRDVAPELAALLERGMRITGADPSVAAAEVGAPSLLERVSQSVEAAAAKEDRGQLPGPSAALVGAVSARRNAAAEHSDTPPIPAPVGPPKPASSPARDRFLAKTYAAAPHFAPAQWTGDDWAITTWLRAVGRHSARRVQALPRVLALRARRICLGIRKVQTVGEDGRPRFVWVADREWSDITARNLAAVVITLYRHAQPTERSGFNRYTKGISLGMLATLLTNPQTGEAYDKRTIQTLIAELRGGPGKGAGAFYSEQPPASVAEPDTIGPSGHATNVYYFTDRACSPGTYAETGGEPQPPRGLWAPPRRAESVPRPPPD